MLAGSAADDLFVRAWPWWGCLALVLAWLGVYICRQVLVYRLGVRAIEKAGPGQVADVVESVTGALRRPRARGSRTGQA